MMGKKTFLVLPKTGLFAPSPEQAGPKSAVKAAAAARPITSIRMEGEDHPVTMLDSAAANGAKLVEMDADTGTDLARRNADGEVRIFENKVYRPMSITVGDVLPTAPITAAPVTAPSPAPTPSALAAAAPPPGLMQVAFSITDSRTGQPIQGATVMLFQNQAAGKGSTGVTDASGQCDAPWLRPLVTIEQLWVMPPPSATYWGYYAQAVPLQDSFAIAIQPVDAAYPDCARYYYPDAAFDPAAKVMVGIIDTGVAPEPALNLVGGENTVAGEDAADFGSNGDPHGTHVAGLVGAQGPMRGTAPGVALRSYRVFGADGAGATSYAIIKAVMAGVADGCDVLNLSLGVDGEDPPLQEAIRHARAHGVLVVAAGNNNKGGPVGSPACYPESIGISAIGHVGCLPPNAQAQAHVTDTRGTDPECFFADFSCVGPSLKLSGPGVGVVSTVPGGYGQLSGTSMATPLIAGYAAALLAKAPHILSAKRDAARSDALANALLGAAKSLGLAADQQGHGLPN